MIAGKSGKDKTNRFKRLPILQGLVPLDKSRIPEDIFAGITLAALGIPEVMGYTKIIDMPVVTGLYTILLPMLVFALLGSSRHLVVGADSATAAIVAATLIALAIPRFSTKYFELVKLIALITGCMLLLARIFRVGFIADFLSRSVLVGFLSGVGLQVAFRELPHILGLPKGGHHFIGELIFTFQHISQTNSMSLLISSITIGVIVGFDKIAPRFPGALLAVIGMMIVSAMLIWGDQGIPLIGEVPGGLPTLSLPEITWKDVLTVLPVSFSCFIVILAQSAATSRAYAVKYHEQFNENLDLVGLAMANIAAGCSNTFIVNGSPTKTAMVDTAGGKSQVSQLATVTIVILVLLFLTKPLSYLPNAVLSAIVFLIGIKLIKIRGLIEILKVKPREFLLSVVTSLTVVFVGVEQGILLAIVLSLLQLVKRSYQPHTGIILYDPNEKWKLGKVAPDEMVEPGLMIYWFGAELFYANANHFSEEIRMLVNKTNPKLHWLVIDASALTNIDYSAGLTLRELKQYLAREQIVMAFTRVDSDLRAEMDLMGLTELIDPQFLFPSRETCIQAYKSRHSS